MKLPAPAKLNLSLDILGRREDGYHELSMVMLSVSLCDGIELNLTPKPGVLFSCSDPDVPGGEKNTACRAAALFLERAGLAETTGVRIFLEKRIPSQAGMGGGSADAAAVLRGLNELTGFPLPEENLFELGLQVGADVPFCLAGGVKLAQGVGERLSPAPELPPCAIVVCKPPVGVSTAEAFRRSDERTDGGKDYTGAVLAALKTGSLEAVGEALGNDFEDVMRLPEVEAIKERLLQAGAVGACMTGSGSAVFGLFRDAKDAQACAFALLPEWHDTFLCFPVPRSV